MKRVVQEKAGYDPIAQAPEIEEPAKKSIIQEQAEGLVDFGNGMIEDIKQFDILDNLLTPEKISNLSDNDLKVLHRLSAVNMHICGEIIDTRIDEKTHEESEVYRVVELTYKIEEAIKTGIPLTRDEMLEDIYGILQARKDSGNNLSFTDISDAKVSQCEVLTERFSSRITNLRLDATGVDLTGNKVLFDQLNDLKIQAKEQDRLLCIKKYTCDIIDELNKPNSKKLPELYKELEKYLGKRNTMLCETQLSARKNDIKTMSSDQLDAIKMNLGDHLCSRAPIDLEPSITAALNIGLQNQASRTIEFKPMNSQELVEVKQKRKEESDRLEQEEYRATQAILQKKIEEYITEVQSTAANLKAEVKDRIKSIVTLSTKFASQNSDTNKEEIIKKAIDSANDMVKAAGESKYGSRRYHIGQAVKWVFNKSDAQKIDAAFEAAFPKPKTKTRIQYMKECVTVSAPNAIRGAINKITQSVSERK